ncbi:MAG: ABC transporter ATP-binding protein [Alphaproteobacteria bacterium]|nr:ABC transporter ATP-binding protein [Alphaproteobacteria bacterium]
MSAETAGATLEVAALTKTFGRHTVVNDVSFRLDGSRLLTLLGPSGSGKTTTMRRIAGFEEPSAGRVLVGGEDITRRPAHKRDIGVVFQQYALFPHLTVRRNVAYPLEMRRLPRREIERRVGEALALVRLEDFAERLPRQLSGGQQQRVALARAVVFKPRVLLMDEPLGALDKRLRETMQVEIRQLQQTLGITTLSVTHDQVEALVMSDLVAVMDGGMLQQIGTPRELYQRPANRFVADFLGASNILAGEIAADAAGRPSFRSTRGLVSPFDAGSRSVPDAGATALVVIRPEHVAIDPRPAAAAEGPGHPCVVSGVVYAGDVLWFRLRAEGGDEILAKTLAGADATECREGDRVVARWRREDCLLLPA